MKTFVPHSSFAPHLMWRIGGVAVVASMMVPLAGCGSNQTASSIPPPVQDAPGTVPQTAPQTSANQGMSTATKLKILAGAAAAYYLYKQYQKSQEAKTAPQNVQYYVSKSTGRIYYRDPQTHQAHFVTPATKQVQVPVDQAQEYSQFQGYGNQTTGKTLQDTGIFKVGP